jgi:hypothetical protein
VKPSRSSGKFQLSSGQITCVRSERTPLRLELDGMEPALYHPVADVLNCLCAISHLSKEQLEAVLTCKRGSASVTFNGAPVGCLPLQNISAEDAARGQTIGSRFSGPDCSLHKSCSPANQKTSIGMISSIYHGRLPPRTSPYCACVKFAKGSKVYA